jgi:hypothetical protein
MTLQARPTVYRGIRMRSRAEARYAAFLDEGPEPWEYEPVAFGGSRGQYLPDFRTFAHGLTFYIEVKPTIERALVQMERMEVIWESDPDAVLDIVVWDAGQFMALGPGLAGRFEGEVRKWIWHPVAEHDCAA